MIFAAFPGERDPHGAILDEQRKRIEVNRGLVERTACAMNVISMAETADNHAIFEHAEMKRHVAGGTMVPIRVELALVPADD